MSNRSSWAAMITATLVLSATSVSCVRSERSIASEADGQVDTSRENAKTTLAEVRAEWKQASDISLDALTKALIYPKCDATVPPGIDCGLTSDAFANRTAFAQFSRNFCRQSSPSRECVESYRQAFVEALRKRYGEVNVALVDVSGNFYEMESTAMKAHNDRAIADYRRRTTEIDAKFNAYAEHVVERFDSEMNAIRTEQAKEQRKSEDRRRVWLGVAEGLQAAGRSLSSQPEPAKLVSCTSDYDCVYGQICLKPNGSMDGRCAQAVNEYGVPIHEPPNPSSRHRGYGQCERTGCPPGFTCEDGNCVK